MPHSRSISPPLAETLRLPRPPGPIRQYWRRHPLLADIVLALCCVLFSIGTVTWIPLVSLYASPATLTQQLCVGVAGGGLVMMRRRGPVAAFTGAWLVAVFEVINGGQLSGLLVLITSYSLAMYRSSRTCATYLAIATSSFAVLSIILSISGTGSGASPFSALVGEATIGLIGALIGVNIGNRRRYLAALIDRSQQLLIERDQQAQLAAAAERERIAREMHDIVSHSLTVIVALSDGAAATPDEGRAKAASAAAAETARNALTEMRSMLGVLRDDADAPLTPLTPITPAEVASTARRAGYSVQLTMCGELTAEPALSLAISRIVQEGVTNAMRYAPRASMIEVQIDNDADPVLVEIVNDCSNPEDEPQDTPQGCGFGLLGLEERVAVFGGTIVSQPLGDGRWMLRAELPNTDKRGPAPLPAVVEECKDGDSR